MVDEINLDTNVQTLYYNGAVFDTFAWSTGTMEIAALDLFSNGGSAIFWDDCSLNDGSVAVEPTSWGRIKSSFK